jgi:hypothetical protein
VALIKHHGRETLRSSHAPGIPSHKINCALMELKSERVVPPVCGFLRWNQSPVSIFLINSEQLKNDATILLLYFLWRPCCFWKSFCVASGLFTHIMEFNLNNSCILRLTAFPVTQVRERFMSRKKFPGCTEIMERILSKGFCYRKKRITLKFIHRGWP